MTEVTCPVCKKLVNASKDLDGLGRATGPLRIHQHAGKEWGRICSKSGSVVWEGK